MSDYRTPWYDTAKGFVALLVCALFLICAVVLGLKALQNDFTTAEQFQAANLACSRHGGIRAFDDIDTDGSGKGPANVICQDGYGQVLLQRTVDP